MGVTTLMPVRVSCDTEGCDVTEDYNVEADSWGWDAVAPPRRLPMPEGWTERLDRTAPEQPWSFLRRNTYCPACSSRERRRKLRIRVIGHDEEQAEFEAARKRMRDSEGIERARGVLEETMAEALQGKDTVRRVYEPEVEDAITLMHVGPEEAERLREAIREEQDD